jgi:hypothetical protein
MKAIRWIEKLLDEVPGTDISYAGGPADPAFVDFVAGRFDKIVPWLVKKGFVLIPMSSRTEFRMASKDKKTAAIGYNAMGKMVKTDFPAGLPQQMRMIIQVGFIDLTSPSFKASLGQRLAIGLMQKRLMENPVKKKRKPPRAGTYSAWLRKINGILLKEINLGTWHLVKQPYEQWFVEGMRPSTVANIIIDGVSMGQIARKYKRKRR